MSGNCLVLSVSFDLDGQEQKSFARSMRVSSLPLNVKKITFNQIEDDLAGMLVCAFGRASYLYGTILADDKC